MTKKLPPEVKQVRKSISRACEFCRRKHIQCDTGRPCQNCIRRNIGHSCRDIKPRRKSKTGVKQNGTNIAPVAASLGSFSPEHTIRMKPNMSTPQQMMMLQQHGNYKCLPNIDQVTEDMSSEEFGSSSDISSSKTLASFKDANNIQTIGNNTNEANNNIEAINPPLCSVNPDVNYYPGNVDNTDSVGENVQLFDNPQSPMSPIFDSTWANDEYMKLKDLVSDSGATFSPMDLNPIDLHLEGLDIDRALQLDGPRDDRDIAGRNTSLRGSIVSTESNPRISNMQADSPIDRKRNNMSTPFISLNMLSDRDSVNTGVNSSSTNSLNLNNSTLGEKIELSPLKYRELVTTPEELFEKQYLIKTHNYHLAYQRLKRLFRDRYDAQPDGATVNELFRELLSDYVPKFIVLTLTMTEQDLFLQEVILQRSLLEYESMIQLVNCTPAAVWRRTGELCYLSNEWILLTGFSRQELLDGSKFIFEYWDDNSVLSYFELFHKYLAFEDVSEEMLSANRKFKRCRLKLKNGAYLTCAVCWTVQRDTFKVPVLVMGQFLPIFGDCL
ncbi:Gsm1p KNAG_0B01720 [Huiozyma naganishii CBS 8797]|uniref:Glucose starvation modulator protein 1 n=1 Tax=Huiozyma naganishii (strain ATCC MYA-139 / BCRC 22969 / CBS 8797 / KCTC 17520 / NBRC 10181 / NCYC 3082 / Yp74L-3) TaxID=1071383 RepID=J7R1D4_HUIN7|nr:hypothetical protein KNAG_0B01720 [Kazachstania naganishii CBS 8797]CCK68615.1 hypothetical protein KNAG_0B01720 [Kazachstania naganishii CBS 8797]